MAQASSTEEHRRTSSVRTAHGDAWQEHGRIRVSGGGGHAEVPGARMMASGLPHPQWNNADITDPDLVDVHELAEWFGRRDVPWGVRVPAEAGWAHGKHLFSKRLMGLEPQDFVVAEPVDRLVVRVAAEHDLDQVAAVDAEAFESSAAEQRPWLGPLLTATTATVALAILDGRPVATAYTLRSDGWAGPALYLAGVGVIPEARRRGIGRAVSSWLVESGFAAGAGLAHLHPASDGAARLYQDIGFTEVPGFEVFVDVEP